MGLWIQVLPGSDEPIYLQIVSQIGQAVARGELSAGDKLPAVRKLAAELVINPNTVVRAYGVLEQQGLISSKTGSGTYITDPALRDRDAGQLNVLAERMDNIVSQALNLGLSPADISGMFKTRLSQFTDATNKEKRKK